MEEKLNNKEIKKENKFKELSDEEFNAQLAKKVYRLKKIFEENNIDEEER